VVTAGVTVAAAVLTTVGDAAVEVMAMVYPPKYRSDTRLVPPDHFR